MILTQYICDGCKKINDNPIIEVKGKMCSIKDGILMPRNYWNFCSVKCLQAWLNIMETY